MFEKVTIATSVHANCVIKCLKAGYRYMVKIENTSTSPNTKN